MRADEPQAGGADDVVVRAIDALVRRRNEEVLDVRPESDLFDDLLFDSLEVAELSAALEDELGTDPFSAGEAPRHVGEIIAFYRAR